MIPVCQFISVITVAVYAPPLAVRTSAPRPPWPRAVSRPSTSIVVDATGKRNPKSGQIFTGFQ